MITIYNESCFEINNHLNENSVDLFFCDPPYYKVVSDKWDNQWKTKDEYLHWVNQWVSLLYKHMKDHGSGYICTSWMFSGDYQRIIEENGFHIKNRITWKRDKGRGSKTNWKSMHEDIWFFTKNDKRYTFNISDVMVEKEVIAPYRDKNGNPKDWWVNEDGKKVRLTYPGNIWIDLCVPFWSSKEVRSYAKTKRTPDNLYKKHPTQKPLDLVKRCIMASSNKDDLVCDMFAGSGTTGIASEQLGRNSILFEPNNEYCNIIKTRINNELRKR
jgi:site-specific DNA-methyltransferase (adenine-specific)